MKWTRCRLFLSCWTLCVLMAAANSATSQTADPPYLAQFPTADQIRSSVKGADAMETAAKQAGALWQLYQLIPSLAYTQHRTDRQFSEYERKLWGEYYGGYGLTIQQFQSTMAPADTAKWFQLHTRYEMDRFLRDEVFRKFLAPQQRTLIYTMLKEQMPSGPPPSNGSTPATATTTAVASSVAVDPDIVKAKAAKVDTNVLGMELGNPLPFKACPFMVLNLGENCVEDRAENAGLFGALMGTITSQVKVDPEIRTVHLVEDSCPSWAVCAVYVRVRDDRIVGVYVLTKGRNVERSTTNELIAKYGRPIGFNVSTITPDVGNPFKVSSPEWLLAGIHVEYEVIQKMDDGGRVNLDNGVVRIELASAYKRRMEVINTPKRKL